MTEALHGPTFDHVWRSRSIMNHRIGQKLRIIAVGMMNSALVEFEDGHRCVTSRFGYRWIGAEADYRGAIAERGAS